MGELIIATFKQQDAAGEVLTQLKKRAFRGIVDLEEAVVAERDSEGKLKVGNLGNLAVEHAAGAGALGIVLGTILGGLVGAAPVGMGIGATIGTGTGALAGIFEQSDDEDLVLRVIQNDLPPGTSALAVVLFVGEDDRKILLADLEGVEGEVIQTTLSAKNEDDLRNQLRKNAAG